jgi:hypothetical protein
MTRLVVVVSLVAAAATVDAKPTQLPLRVPYPPLVAKLKTSGGSPDRVVHVKRAADLDRLESGRRYKFVIDSRGGLAVAPLPADAESNEYVHPILAGGGPVLTAGGIRVDHAGGRITRIVVDQDSKAYCPPRDSLEQAVHTLTSLGIRSDLVTTEDHPPECAPSPSR